MAVEVTVHDFADFLEAVIQWEIGKLSGHHLVVFRLQKPDDIIDNGGGKDILPFIQSAFL